PVARMAGPKNRPIMQGRPHQHAGDRAGAMKASWIIVPVLLKKALPQASIPIWFAIHRCFSEGKRSENSMIANLRWRKFHKCLWQNNLCREMHNLVTLRVPFCGGPGGVFPRWAVSGTMSA